MANFTDIAFVQMSESNCFAPIEDYLGPLQHLRCNSL